MTTAPSVEQHSDTQAMLHVSESFEQKPEVKKIPESGKKEKPFFARHFLLLLALIGMVATFISLATILIVTFTSPSSSPSSPVRYDCDQQPAITTSTFRSVPITRVVRHLQATGPVSFIFRQSSYNDYLRVEMTKKSKSTDTNLPQLFSLDLSIVNETLHINVTSLVSKYGDCHSAVVEVWLPTTDNWKLTDVAVQTMEPRHIEAPPHKVSWLIDQEPTSPLDSMTVNAEKIEITSMMVYNATLSTKPLFSYSVDNIMCAYCQVGRLTASAYNVVLKYLGCLPSFGNSTVELPIVNLVGNSISIDEAAAANITIAAKDVLLKYSTKNEFYGHLLFNRTVTSSYNSLPLANFGIRDPSMSYFLESHTKNLFKATVYSKKELTKLSTITAAVSEPYGTRVNIVLN